MHWVWDRTTGHTPAACLAFVPVSRLCMYGERNGFSSSCSATNTSKDTLKAFRARVLGGSRLCTGEMLCMITPSGAGVLLEHSHVLLSCRSNFCFKTGMKSCVLAFGGFKVVFCLKWEKIWWILFVFEKRSNLHGVGHFDINLMSLEKKSRLHLKTLFVLFLECLLILVASIERENIKWTNKPSESLVSLVRPAVLQGAYWKPALISSGPSSACLLRFVFCLIG